MHTEKIHTEYTRKCHSAAATREYTRKCTRMHTNTHGSVFGPRKIHTVDGILRKKRNTHGQSVYFFSGLYARVPITAITGTRYGRYGYQ